MKKEFKDNYSEEIDHTIPVSIASLVSIPSYHFNVLSRKSFSKWEKSVNTLLVRTYFSLIMSNLIELKYHKNNRKICFIRWEKYSFLPRLSDNEIKLENLSWVEQQFIHAIFVHENVGNSIDKCTFSKQIKMSLSLLLSSVQEYTNPSKSIVERILTTNKNACLTFNKEEKFSGNNKFEIIFREECRIVFQKLIDKIDKKMETYIYNKENKIFIRKLKKAIKKELSRMRFTNEYSG